MFCSWDADLLLGMSGHSVFNCPGNLPTPIQCPLRVNWGDLPIPGQQGCGPGWTNILTLPHLWPWQAFPLIKAQILFIIEQTGHLSLRRKLIATLGMVLWAPSV